MTGIHFPRLRTLARSGGLWEGLSTYLCMVSDYVWYRGTQISLPSAVTMAARFGSDQVSFSKKIPANSHLAALCQPLCHRTETVDVERGTAEHSASEHAALPGHGSCVGIQDNGQ